MEAEEFRIVINKEDLIKFNPDKNSILIFTDYYISRNKRVRFNLKGYPHGRKELENKIILITSNPGTINKEMSFLEKSQAEEMIKDSIFIVEKKGIGLVNIGGITGYSERVIAFKVIKKSKEKVIDEIQIEFEEDISKVDIIKERIKIIKLIDEGMFDYISKI